MKFKLVIIFIISLLTTYKFTFAQTFSETRKITRIFDADPGVTIDVTNKYGKIQVNTWNNDSVKIEIFLSVKSGSESRLERIMSSIDFDFSVNESFIIVKTAFSSSFANILSEIINFAEPLTIGDNDVDINYSVYIPRNINVTIDNKYGDVILNDLISELKLIILNGDLKANNLSGPVDISIKFGNGYVNSIDSGRLDVSYSTLNLKQSDKLTIDSKSSKINIDGCNDLNISSKRDKYFISEVNYFRGETSFSDLVVDNLYHDFNFKMSYGNLKIDYIPKSFSLVNVSSQYTNLNFIFEKFSSYNVDITSIDVKMNFPKELSKLQEQVIDQEQNKTARFGTAGKEKTDARLNIYAEHSTINISYKQ